LLGQVADAYRALDAYADNGTLHFQGGPGKGDELTVEVPIRFLRTGRMALDMKAVAYVLGEDELTVIEPPPQPMSDERRNDVSSSVPPDFYVSSRIFPLIPARVRAGFHRQIFHKRPDDAQMGLAALGGDLLAFPIGFLNQKPINVIIPLPAPSPAIPKPGPPLPNIYDSRRPDELVLRKDRPAESGAFRVLRLVYREGPDISLEIDPASKLIRRMAWIVSALDDGEKRTDAGAVSEREGVAWSSGEIRTDRAEVTVALEALKADLVARSRELAPPLPPGSAIAGLPQIAGNMVPSKVFPAGQSGTGAKVVSTGTGGYAAQIYLWIKGLRARSGAR